MDKESPANKYLQVFLSRDLILVVYKELDQFNWPFSFPGASPHINSSAVEGTRDLREREREREYDHVSWRVPRVFLLFFSPAIYWDLWMCLNRVGVLYLYFRIGREVSEWISQSSARHCFVSPWDVVSISYFFISRQCTVWSQLIFPPPLIAIFLKNPSCQPGGTTSASNRSVAPLPFGDLLLACSSPPTYLNATPLPPPNEISPLLPPSVHSRFF